jgi:AraC family transcriptional activator of mtrCDE
MASIEKVHFGVFVVALERLGSPASSDCTHRRYRFRQSRHLLRRASKHQTRRDEPRPRSSRGERTDIFATMTLQIVEAFDPTEHPIGQLKAVLAELAAPRVGTTAMTTALLKQVLVMVLRRKLMRACPDLQGLLLLRDPLVACAFADMVVRPGAPHSLLTLAKTASLSRSAFIERFTRAVGRPPMLALRHIRMRHAADLLKADVLSVKQVASAVGYSSRSSFVRAFRSVHAIDPSAYRASALESGT